MTEIEERTLKEAEYIIKTKQTIRQASNHFAISKSTLHNDLKLRLPRLNKNLYKRVQKILQEHFDEKHIRGGQATKLKLMNAKKNKLYS